MNRQDLQPFLDREIERWSAKAYQTLRDELREGNFADANPGSEYHVEVDLLENRADYVHVSVAVCSEHVRRSCLHALSRSFLVYRDGRIKK
ncbi:MAG TPA: hypothetical protein VKU44_06330 [Terriglobia bacterium]|nr:hypothetical protein [Terriglobia bacterium]